MTPFLMARYVAHVILRNAFCDEGSPDAKLSNPQRPILKAAARRRDRQAGRLRYTALFACLMLLASAPLQAASPDLVVIISIDQFPYEFIQRFRPYLSEEGFGRFLKTGADFENASFRHSVTFTGPGHASIGTGRTPAEHGIIANYWFDRLAGRGEYCVADPGTRPTAGATAGMSPNNLASDSLGDRLVEKSPASKVIGIAIKDRSAILMAGRKASAAYWFDPKLEGFVSSTYYRSNPSVLAFNAQVATHVAAHPSWTQSSFIPQADLARLTYDPPELRKYKTDRGGMGVAFPHPVKDAAALTYTPFGNDLVLDFARHIIDTENLGTDDGAPDILFIGLSSPDYLGHNFGPDSLEAADSVVRTDRSIGAFLTQLDGKIGSRYVAAITADHGVQAIPEVARARGLDAGRIDLRDPAKEAKSLSELTPQRLALELAVARKLKVKLNPSAPLDQALIRFFDEPAFYLNWERVAKLGLDAERVKLAFRDAVRKMPGVSAAYTNSELMTAGGKATEIQRAVKASFRADRSGDVLVTLKPGYIWSYAPTGTNHGQPVERDQHVPLMFWGEGVKAGRYTERVAPTDLAKTLGAMLGVQAGGSESVVLPCVSNE